MYAYYLQQDVLSINSTMGHMRKHSVPDNFHKPPSPRELEAASDPLIGDKAKQSVNPTSSLTNKSVCTLQQRVQSTPKSSPPLAAKRSTAIPRKPTSSSMTTSKSIGYSVGLAEVDYQMGLPNSHSNEELVSILGDSIDGPSSPPPVVMETQPEQSFHFTRYPGQQVRET